ncbi:MAG: ABC transporter ATP-binding protein/permease [Flavobacteriaceae bacterium]|nr:ABC transporter ATP-binding protein/permease [Flavobacteriaceae bacterium]
MKEKKFDIKKLLNFTYFKFYWKYLKWRMLVILLFSFLMGLLDGLGLTMFIPLFELATNDGGAVSPEKLGDMKFVVEWIEAAGIDLTINKVLVFMLLLFSLKGLLVFAESTYKLKVRLNFVRKLRFDHFDDLDALEYKHFTTSDSGRIQNTLSGEVGAIVNSFTHYFGTLKNLILLCSYIGLALVSNFQFSIFIILGAIITNGIYSYFYKKTKQLSREKTKVTHGFQGLLIQFVQHFKYLKATNNSKKYKQKLKDIIEDAIKIDFTKGILSGILSGIREPMTIAIIVLAIYVQLNFFSAPFGSILLSLLFFYRSLNYLVSVQNSWNQFLGVTGSMENTEAFKEEMILNKEQKGELQPILTELSLSIKEVDFYYGSEQILNQINLDIPNRSTVALVGESGSGKTTLVNMIAGLLKPDQGCIQIGNYSLNDIDLNYYRSKIGYITQEPAIFNDTLFNNVTFWDEPSAENLERFNEALKKAALYDFVQTLKNRHEVKLGDNGVTLSGGQKQRVSIARELYRDIEILILDEATSALDSQTEHEIQTNIDSLKGQFTTIIIAHRLSTVKNADQIVLMDQGKVLDVAPLEELALKNKKFKQMLDLQEF